MLFLTAVDLTGKRCNHFCPQGSSKLFEVTAACCRHLQRDPLMHIKLSPDRDMGTRFFLWHAFHRFFVNQEAMYDALPLNSECEIYIYDLPPDDACLVEELRLMLGLTDTVDLTPEPTDWRDLIIGDDEDDEDDEEVEQKNN